MESESGYRSAGVAGTFYPADKLSLERELSLLLENAPVLDLPRPVRGIISPHAGYIYSGGVAAKAYRQLFDHNYKRVVVIAPSHQDTFPFISVYNGEGYQTPLGKVQVDQELAEQLSDSSEIIKLSNKGHSQAEHSLEVQLPFLQWILGSKFRLIPIAMGIQSEAHITSLHQSLVDVIPSERTLIVASSDLSHFHPDPDARTLDQSARRHIEMFREDDLYQAILSRDTEMCGFGPVVAAMKTVRDFGARQSQVLLYRNSGDITGEKNNVVGYLSAVLY